MSTASTGASSGLATPIVVGARYVRVYAFGAVLALIGVVYLLPLFALPFYSAELWLLPAFGVPGGGLIVLGIICMGLSGGKARQAEKLSVADGSVIILAAWVVAICVSTVPFLVQGEVGFVAALFESTSAWTTTGLSVVDVEQAPRLILLWRSTMQLAGGAGFAIIMISALSLPIGMGVCLAEGRSDQLVPNVIRSVKLVFVLYIVYATVGTVAYAVAGMSVFDAINHSFAAVSTGGFSTRDASIGYWQSPSIEWISIPLMILGNMNFLIAYALLRGRVSQVLRSGEIQAFLVLWVLCFAGIMLTGMKDLLPVRVAAFEATTALTTTGFSVVDYSGWSDAAYAILISVMLVGGGSGSTAGGIKQIRVYILARAALSQVKAVLLPRRVITQPQFVHGESRITISADMSAKAGAFLFAYLMLFGVGVAVLSANGVPFLEAVFEFASSIGTVGLSVGLTSPDLPAAVLLTQIAGMILGRLEIFMFFSGILAGLRILARTC